MKMTITDRKREIKLEKFVSIRDSEQQILPQKAQKTKSGTYNLFPDFPIGEGKIGIGYANIAEKISKLSHVVIDGYAGVLWQNFRDNLHEALKLLGVRSIHWIDVSDYMLQEEEIAKIKDPFLGGDDPIFGTRFTGDIRQFFDMERLNRVKADDDSDVSILYGCGAALSGWNTEIIYLDLPKNELQYRSRAGSVTNFGRSNNIGPKQMYKEFYFVDWILLNKHKASIINEIDWMVDEQRPDDPAIMSGSDFRDSLQRLSQSAFRVRPWFEPGVWGGQWCKEHIPQLPKDVPNYAWSFEMIVPENGLILSSDENLLEISFDWLMYAYHQAVLGDSSEFFGYEFPIRFDFLDTFDGENLSLQCHPNTKYIKDHFGEPFTQDETYYILDCEEDAEVYLGFREDIDPEQFRLDLEKAVKDGSKVNVKDYVLTHSAQKHDLFLIPNGTIHCSGVNNLVLEISATPYIFTFKMYDWQRLDLNGKPRPINIDRAFDNLNFDRKGRHKIEEEFISSPKIIDSGKDWKIVHLPTHPFHFYDIQRFEFQTEIEIENNGSCHVLNLVEGSSIIVQTANGTSQHFNYAETFAIPAAADSYSIVNLGDEPAKVVMAFIKDALNLQK